MEGAAGCAAGLRSCSLASISSASVPSLHHLTQQPCPPPSLPPGLPERIDLTLDGSGQSLVLADFALQQLELDSALALLEHLAEL